MIVKFLKPQSPYNAGERAEFSESETARLIRLGIVAPDPPVVTKPIEPITKPMPAPVAKPGRRGQQQPERPEQPE